jgi:hypothetical protein
MVGGMELTKATVELLRDEAYVTLCREAIEECLETRKREKVQAASSRAPFAQPVPPRTNPPTTFKVDDTDVALLARLTRVNQLETWLKRRIRNDLMQHLEETNPTFQCCVRIQQWLNEWEFCVRHVLPESLGEFGRELRGLRAAVGEVEQRRGPQPFAREFFSLRKIAARLEEQQWQVARIASAVSGHAQQIGARDVNPPVLPNFRRLVWVDWLAVVPVGHLVAEVTRIEGEIRSFLNRGLNETMDRLQACRDAGNDRQDAILRVYWNRLRTHAQSHYVEERDVDDVLDSLGRRYDPEIARFQRETTRSPFLADF